MGRNNHRKKRRKELQGKHEPGISANAPSDKPGSSWHLDSPVPQGRGRYALGIGGVILAGCIAVNYWLAKYGADSEIADDKPTNAAVSQDLPSNFGIGDLCDDAYLNGLRQKLRIMSKEKIADVYEESLKRVRDIDKYYGGIVEKVNPKVVTVSEFLKMPNISQENRREAEKRLKSKNPDYVCMGYNWEEDLIVVQDRLNIESLIGMMLKNCDDEQILLAHESIHKVQDDVSVKAHGSYKYSTEYSTEQRVLRELQAYFLSPIVDSKGIAMLKLPLDYESAEYVEALKRHSKEVIDIMYCLYGFFISKPDVDIAVAEYVGANGSSIEEFKKAAGLLAPTKDMRDYLRLIGTRFIKERARTNLEIRRSAAEAILRHGR